MQIYKNEHGDSGVVSFELGSDYIKIQFKSPIVYVYTHKKPGQDHVEKMKKLALDGRGLATYISQNVNENFEYKE